MLGLSGKGNVSTPVGCFLDLAGAYCSLTLIIVAKQYTVDFFDYLQYFFSGDVKFLSLAKMRTSVQANRQIYEPHRTLEPQALN